MATRRAKGWGSLSTPKQAKRYGKKVNRRTASFGSSPIGSKHHATPKNTKGSKRRFF